MLWPGEEKSGIKYDFINVLHYSNWIIMLKISKWLLLLFSLIDLQYLVLVHRDLIKSLFSKKGLWSPTLKHIKHLFITEVKLEAIRHQSFRILLSYAATILIISGNFIELPRCTWFKLPWLYCISACFRHKIHFHEGWPNVANYS